MNIQEKNKAAINESIKRLKETYSPDEMIMQAVKALKEEEFITNIKYERLTDMYWRYWPEKTSEAREMKDLLKIIKEPPKDSMGYDLSTKEKKLIIEYKKNLTAEVANKELLEQFINEETVKLAPRTSKLITPLLTARLITLAKGFRKLAMLPASTIQLLGAEKALFIHLTRGAKPPKHGLIITSKQVQEAREKGKAARQLANQIMKTVRQDYFGGNNDK